MSERVHIFAELWSGKIIQQEHGHFQATIAIAKSIQKKYGPDIKWICVYTNSKTLYEYIDNYYEELLNILYTRNPAKKTDGDYYNNLLSVLSKSNPALFDKYLDWIQTDKIKINNQ